MSWLFNYVQLVIFSDCWVAHSRILFILSCFWAKQLELCRSNHSDGNTNKSGITRNPRISALLCLCVENPVFVWEVQLPLRYGKHQYLVGGKSNIKCFKGFSSPVQIYRHLPGSQPAVDWSVQGPCDDFGRWLQVAIAVVYNFLQIAFLNVRTGDYQLQSQ